MSIASFWIAAELELGEETLMCHFLQEKVNFSDSLPVHLLLATPKSMLGCAVRGYPQNVLFAIVDAIERPEIRARFGPKSARDYEHRNRRLTAPATLPRPQRDHERPNICLLAARNTSLAEPAGACEDQQKPTNGRPRPSPQSPAASCHPFGFTFKAPASPCSSRRSLY